MPPRTINPQFSQWMQDFFSKEGSLPSLYQGMPIYGQTGYDLTPMEFMKEWGVEHLPPAGIISDYPGFKEKYEVLDYMIGGEKIREGVESERYKLQDLLESVQTTGPEGLRVGGVSRDLENQRETINQGLVDLEAKKDFGLKAQETELAQDIYDLRAGHEEQASRDYLAWLSDYTGLGHTGEIRVNIDGETEVWLNGEWVSPSDFEEYMDYMAEQQASEDPWGP
tara:strand:+ start:18 stop:689 length:672 start_codon:yes stop_codon:yes gene_type:complete